VQQTVILSDLQSVFEPITVAAVRDVPSLIERILPHFFVDELDRAIAKGAKASSGGFPDCGLPAAGQKMALK